MHINFLKSGLIVFSFVQEWNSNFYSQLELTDNNCLYSFGHEEIVDFFVCFALKCKRTSAFLIRLANCFSMIMCLDSDKKIVPLCYKHVIAMSSNKIREKYH